MEGQRQTRGSTVLHTLCWSGKLRELSTLVLVPAMHYQESIGCCCAGILTHHSSHILLQLTEHQLYALQSILVPDLSFITAALHASRVMACKMLRVAMQVVKTEREILHVPFAALCAVLRGSIVVLETRREDDEDVMTEGDLDGLVRITKWLAGRWSIGKEYLRRMEQLL
jgi:hypothetical protein